MPLVITSTTPLPHATAPHTPFLPSGQAAAVTPASVPEAPPPPTPPPCVVPTPVPLHSRRPVLPLTAVAPRDRILAHLSRRPGIHLRALQRSLGMELSTLDHHIRMLDRQERIVVRSIGHYKALYPVAGLDRRDRDILFYLGQDKPLRILDLIATSSSATHSQLAHALHVAPATCSFHLKKLFAAGLLDQERHGRIMHWTLHDADRVVDLMRRFTDCATRKDDGPHPR